MIFVGCVTVIKNRGAPTWQHYMKKFMLYAKVANIYLFWRQHPAYGVVYLVLCAGMEREDVVILDGKCCVYPGWRGR